jgi:hypothetical protein
VTEREQLTLDSLVSPAGILPGHALDQHDHRVRDGWTPTAVRARPFLGDQAPVPTQDCARCDQAMPPQHLRQPSGERGEHCAIRPVQVRLRVGSTQHGDFMTQHQELDVLGRRRTSEQHQQVHQLTEDQIEQAQEHGSRSCPADRPHQLARSATQADFWNPTGSWMSWQSRSRVPAERWR